VSKSALSHEKTLQSLATRLGPTEALVVGNLTGGFPLLVSIGPLPQGFPATGQTRSFWDAKDASDQDARPQALAA
jgi:hypothetical protein